PCPTGSSSRTGPASGPPRPAASGGPLPTVPRPIRPRPRPVRAPLPARKCPARTAAGRGSCRLVNLLPVLERLEDASFLKLHQHVVEVRRPVLLLLRQELQHKVPKLVGEVRIVRHGCRGLLDDVFTQEFVLGVRPERRPARGQLIQHAPETVNVPP